jgi:aspartyl-tRNA(Asn)/glutamyl-tRNA(Gln) amidotransferase subunit B
MNYETVIGLEVHVELATQSKIFCGCPAQFGAQPNTQVCPICAGLPGALPNLNRQALELGMRAGLATGCQITPVTRFDRKHYFYPDLPKAFQISQLYAPLAIGGAVCITNADRTEKMIRIHEIHLEEDAGKLVHDPWTDATWIDLNRCGVPLISICLSAQLAVRPWEREPK